MITYRKFLLIVLSLLLVFWIGKSLFLKGQGSQAALYFFKDESLVTVKREVSGIAVVIPRIALDELLKGPTLAEKQKGYLTQLPENIKVRSFIIENKIARVDLSRELENCGGGTARIKGLLAQMVYTLTRFRSIDKVRLLIEGKENFILGGEGYIIDRPMGRQDVRF